MIILISGSSHVGKTMLAQRLLERYHYPYLSVDHLKMGLIRSGLCKLTPEATDEQLTEYLWPVVREIIKTAIENRQNLIVEGCYIPFDYRKEFDERYQREICYLCLIFSEEYIRTHFADIREHACAIERRLDDSGCTEEILLHDNAHNLSMCRQYECDFIQIKDRYDMDEIIRQSERIVRKTGGFARGK